MEHIKIDWNALGMVSITTIAAAVLVVGVFSVATSAMGEAERREGLGHSAGPHKALGYAGYALAGLFVLYGLYLVIPFLHHK